MSENQFLKDIISDKQLNDIEIPKCLLSILGLLFYDYCQ